MSVLAAISLATVILLLPIFVLRKEYGLYALLIVLPLIDAFASYTVFTYQTLTLNLNAVVALLVIGWFVSIVLTERVALSRIPGVGWLMAFLAWGAASLGVSLDVMTTISFSCRCGSVESRRVSRLPFAVILGVL